MHRVPSQSSMSMALGGPAAYLILVATIALHSCAARATESQLALVLGGGGARGGAHVGILKELDRQRIVPDIIVGTSMGALVGGLYAAGHSGIEIESLLENAKLETLFQQILPRESRSFRRKEDDNDLLVKLQLRLEGRKLVLPGSLVSSHRFRNWLTEQFPANRDNEPFFGMDVKFAAIGTDLVTGNMIVIDSGSIDEAIYASMAVPGLMDPVERGNQLVVDGGLVSNLPIAAAKRLGASHVIAVDVGTPFYQKDGIKNSINSIDQMTRLLVRGNTEETIAAAEQDENTLLLRPELDGLKTASFTDLSTAIAEGDRVATLRRREIGRFSGTSKRDDAPIRKRQGDPHEGSTVRSLRFITDSALSDKYLRSYFQTQEGKEFRLEEMENDLRRLYGTELFERIHYTATSDDEHIVDLEVSAFERQGRDFLQFGLTLDEDFKSVSEYGLNFSFTRTQLNSRGAEWITRLRIGNNPLISTELFQPFGARSNYFASVSGTFSSPNEETADDTGAQRLNVYVLQTRLGRYISNWGSVSIGQLAGRLQANETSDFDFRATTLNLDRDTLDDPAFPAKGMRLTLASRWTQVELDDFSRSWNELTLDFAKFFSRGRHTYAFWGTLAGVVGTSATENTVSSGGLFNFSGYGRDDLSLNRVRVARGLYYRQLGRAGLRNVFSFPVYAGASLEYGDIQLKFGEQVFANDIVAGSGFVGINSVFGPLFLGVGAADTGEQRVYLSLGRPFVYDLTSTTLDL